MSLRAIFERQAENQRVAYGHEIDSMAAKERIDFIHWNVLALQAEVIELLEETPWKPWSKNFATGEYHTEAIESEAADIVCFFVNILLACGITSEALEAAYFAKADKNASRQTEGYDVSDAKWKCPVCGRALDDPGTKCRPGYCAGGDKD